MNRVRIALLAGALLAGLLPLASVASASPAVVQENVRFVTNVPGTTGGHAVVEGDRLYVGAYGLGMRIFDVSEPAAPREVGRYIPGFQSLADPGLRADAVPDAAVLDGRHIATLNGTGRAPGTQQTEFLDVTDPANPVLLHRFTGDADGEAHNGDIVDERRWWLPSGGRSTNGLRIYDLNPLLETPGRAPTALFRGNPVTMWNASPYRRGRPVGNPFTHTHDFTVYTDHRVLLPQEQWRDQDGDGVAEETYALRDIALLAEGGSYLNNAGNTGSVFVIDITDPRMPVVLNRFVKSAEQGHPIRYYHEAQLLDADPSVLIVADEDLHNGCEAGGVSTFRLSEDLTEATWLADWFEGVGTPSAICSAHVFSTAGPYMFMGAYNSGLQVIDLSDPAKPKRAGQYIAAGANSWGALWHRGYVYVGDLGARGLDVFEFFAPGVSDPCRGRSIPLAEGERLVRRSLFLHGTSPSGNADAQQDTVDGAASRLFMDANPPTSTSHKAFVAPNYVVGPNPNFAQNSLTGYWIRRLDRPQRIVCAEAVVYAATASGSLQLQLWLDAPRGLTTARPAATGTGTSTPNQVSPYRVNFGELDRVADIDLLVQGLHSAPGSLLYYDSTARPSWFSYVTVEQTG